MRTPAWSSRSRADSRGDRRGHQRSALSRSAGSRTQLSKAERPNGCWARAVGLAPSNCPSERTAVAPPRRICRLMGDPGQRECGCGANPSCEDLPPRVSAVIRHYQMFAQSSLCVLGVHRVSSKRESVADRIEPAICDDDEGVPIAGRAPPTRRLPQEEVPQSTTSRSGQRERHYVVGRAG
jgi:hypothetical protein